MVMIMMIMMMMMMMMMMMKVVMMDGDEYDNCHGSDENEMILMKMRMKIVKKMMMI